MKIYNLKGGPVFGGLTMRLPSYCTWIPYTC